MEPNLDLYLVLKTMKGPPANYSIVPNLIETFSDFKMNSNVQIIHSHVENYILFYRVHLYFLHALAIQYIKEQHVMYSTHTVLQALSRFNVCFRQQTEIGFSDMCCRFFQCGQCLNSFNKIYSMVCNILWDMGYI